MDYSDIIDHPHHVSEKHPHMTMQKRAAQFTPFAALTGYEQYLEEARKLNNSRFETITKEEPEYYIPDDFG